MGIKAGVIFFGARIMMLVLSFSSTTNDTSRFRWRSLALLACFAVVALLFLTFGVTGIMVQYEVISWPCSLLTLLIGYAFFRIYGWFYHANRFDLMRLPKR